MAPRKISIEDIEKWPSVKDVADELGRSRQGIRNMLASRDLTGVHTRIGWLVDPASVRAFRLLRQDDGECAKRAERVALIRKATHMHEVRA